MTLVDRPGIFKAHPVRWAVQEAKDSKAVWLWVDFGLDEFLQQSEWFSWAEYNHNVYGKFFVIKKDGTVNTDTVDHLVESGLWSGDLAEVLGPVPGISVQVTVKDEEYIGKDGQPRTSRAVAWIRPGDYSPKAPGLDEGGVQALVGRYGSLLRAAAAAAKAKKAKTQPQTAASSGGS